MCDINNNARNNAMKEYFTKHELELLRIAILDAQSLGNRKQQLEYEELLKSFQD